MMTSDTLRDQIEAALLAGKPTTALREAFAKVQAAADDELARRRAAVEAAEATAAAAIEVKAAELATEAEVDLRELLASLTPPPMPVGE